MGLPKQEYWSGLLFPPLEDLPNPGVELIPPVTPALAGGFFTAEPPGKSLRKTLLLLSHFSHVQVCTTP